MLIHTRVCDDDLYHTCTFDYEAVMKFNNSSLEGATEVNFAPIRSS